MIKYIFIKILINKDTYLTKIINHGIHYQKVPKKEFLKHAIIPFYVTYYKYIQIELYMNMYNQVLNSAIFSPSHNTILYL